MSSNISPYSDLNFDSFATVAYECHYLRYLPSYVRYQLRYNLTLQITKKSDLLTIRRLIPIWYGTVPIREEITFGSTTLLYYCAYLYTDAELQIWSIFGRIRIQQVRILKTGSVSTGTGTHQELIQTSKFLHINQNSSNILMLIFLRDKMVKMLSFFIHLYIARVGSGSDDQGLDPTGSATL